MGEQVLVASCAGWFYALDRATGAVNWKFDIRRDGAQQFHDEMLVLDDRVVIGTDTSKGNTHALDLVTGAEHWRRPCGTAMRANMVRVGDLLYGIARQKEADELFCVRADDGTDVWTVDRARNKDAGKYFHAPLLLDGAIAFGATDGLFVMYDAATGRTDWVCDVGSPIVTSLLLADGFVYGGTSDDRIFRLDLAKRAVDASFTLPGRARSVPADLGDRVGVMVDWRTRDSKLVILDKDLDTVRWTWTPETTADFGTLARLTRRGDTVMVATQQGNIMALDLADGSVRWRTRVEEAVRSLGFHEGTMYVGTIPGPLYAIRLDAITR